MMMNVFEPITKASFFDDIGPLEEFNFWKPLSSTLRRFSDIKHVEGILFKKSKRTNFWKSRYYVLFDDRLAYFKNGREKIETAYCLIQNMRVEVIKSSENEKDEKFGIRFIHNRQYMELYARSLEVREKWMGKLKQFCTLNNYADQYTNIKLVGQGSFAKVYMVKNKIDGKELAVKTFDKRQLGTVERAKASLINEINIMRKMNHENIIKLHEVHESETSIYLVLELLRGGELFERIVRRGVYTEKDASTLMKKLLSALEYMHSKGIMHRDIKPENLILKETDTNYEVKIADFGLATVVNQGEYLFKRCGTPGYVAPEILADEKYDQKVDIFSAGVILYILLTGMSPFHGKSYNEILMKNKNCAINFNIKDLGRGVSEQAIDLLSKMLARDPKERISGKECLEHPWIASGGSGEQGDKANVGMLSSAQENMKRFQEEHRFNVKNIKPKDLDQNPMERPIHCPSPVINGRMITIVESKKRAPNSNFKTIDEKDEGLLSTDEIQAGEKNYKNNVNLLASVYSTSTKSSLNTPLTKPDSRIQGKINVKKAFDVQTTLLGMLRSNESKPLNTTVTSDFQEKKEKEVQKNVANVKMNLRKLF
eukprot:CAMPEP_0176415868 /NCGR_PEP_ID=MMETSP0127-20121128/6037_1 /TAXON_ID=938130 /ORGANISM="Platyophrya macrostoma, Strain WH" /LENGTH=596 /DNA_ID=CAMNT_0017795895 /DNA_START=34 /DNA_END=1824 /DNA_ORIENTATION=-